MLSPLAVNRFLRSRDGSLTVEFVAIVPVLLAALVFSFEFGRALWAYDVMSRDVRAAARYLSRAPSPALEATQTSAENVAQTGSPVGTAKHFPWSADTAEFAFTPTAFSSDDFNLGGNVYRISASLPLTLGFLDFIGVETEYTLVVADEVRWIGE